MDIPEVDATGGTSDIPGSSLTWTSDLLGPGARPTTLYSIIFYDDFMQWYLPRGFLDVDRCGVAGAFDTIGRSVASGCVAGARPITYLSVVFCGHQEMNDTYHETLLM